MDKPWAGSESREDVRSVTAGVEDGESARGAVHSFVEVAELRRIMGRLTALEMLRLLLTPEAQPHGA